MKQNDMEHLQDLMQQGKITAEEANIMKVEIQRVVLVTGKVPASVRKALMAGVKSGRLQHKKSDGRKPEVFYKTGFEYLANTERSEYEHKILTALSRVCT